MVDNIVTKPLGLVLIVTAHMVFNGPSRAEVTGILGSSVTLQFTFNVTVTEDSHYAVYITGQRKIAECSPFTFHSCSGEGIFYVYPENVSVFCRISNLKPNHSDTYWASLFMVSGPPKQSNKVQLIVQEGNVSSTVSPMPTNSTITFNNDGSSRLSSFHIVTVLVVLSIVLLAAVLPWFVWCLVRTKDKQQQQQQSSNPTVQETVEASNNVPAPSLVYSVLDFPKRPLAVLEKNPNDTEYAAVSYLSEKRQV